MNCKSLCTSVLLALAAATVPAHADWPLRAVTLVVPSSPGGGTDTFGRLQFMLTDLASVRPHIDADKLLAPAKVPPAVLARLSAAA